MVSESDAGAGKEAGAGLIPSWGDPQLAPREQAALLPGQPGVYIFRDARDRMLYVGKARSLRQRVATYFTPGAQLTARIRAMIPQVRRIDHLATDNEVEALILESNLVKRNRPRYNVRLRDDKQYPYIKITTQEPWPRVTVVRQVDDDGATYFGPFTNVGAVRHTLRILRGVFPYRTCSNHRLYAGGRPCLYHYIDLCDAPCDDRTTPAAYGAQLEGLIEFLSGRGEATLKSLQQEMERAAEAWAFERAAELRDQVKALEAVSQRQKVMMRRSDDEDILGMARAGSEACVQVFFVRNGGLVGRDHFSLLTDPELADAGVLAAFIAQYYAQAVAVPHRLVVPVEPLDVATITAWLSERRGSSVELRRPQRGEKRRLLEMVAKNARLMLKEEQLRRQQEAARTTGALGELAGALELNEPPRRIECYDISNLQGEAAAGSMVVFVDGQPAKDQYRRFQIQSKGPDDYAMLEEVLYRRFRRGLAERGELDGDGKVADGTGGFAALPDLVVVDGGAGQAGRAREVMELFQLDEISVFGLAKEEELLYRPGSARDPVRLAEEGEARGLVQRIRDEAHRFAVSYHRRLRARRSIRSELDEIPGVGGKRRAALLRHFGSLDRIRQASLDELAQVPTMNRGVAKRVREHLAKRGEGGAGDGEAALPGGMDGEGSGDGE